MRKLLIIRGIPGTGKTTLAKNLIARGLYKHHFEADQYFTKEDGTYEYRVEDIGKAHAQCKKNTKDAMKTGENIIVSNTFIRRWEVYPYIEMANENNYYVIGLTMTHEYGNIHNVPRGKIEDMRSNFDHISWEALGGCTKSLNYLGEME